MNKIAVIDIETTNFQGRGGLIVEVGIVSLDLDTGDVVEEFNSLVREEEFSEAHTEGTFGWVFKNSDLTYEDVDNALSFTKVSPLIQAVLDKFPLGVTAFNKRFDLNFLRDRGLIIPKELPCIMLTAKDPVNVLGKYGKPKWPKVTEAWAHFFPDTPYDEAHRGLDDAKHEAMITYKLYQLGLFTVGEEQ